ncbi:MAG TPA: hypothetical protein PKX92_05195 [Edaphocola sp.]|nr:hypothetical protein [Edaphocola sp.]
MKKIILIPSLCIISFNSFADIKIINKTNCSYVLSIPNVGYYSIPSGNSVIPNSDLVTDIKVSRWASYPSGSPTDYVFVQLYTIPFGTRWYPSCSGASYSCKYSFIFLNDTLLEIF